MTIPDWLKDTKPLTDRQMELYELHSALAFEIEELQTYAGLLPDKREVIEAQIKGIKTAQGYLWRALNKIN